MPPSYASSRPLAPHAAGLPRFILHTDDFTVPLLDRHRLFTLKGLVLVSETSELLVVGWAMSLGELRQKIAELRLFKHWTAERQSAGVRPLPAAQTWPDDNPASNLDEPTAWSEPEPAPSVLEVVAEAVSVFESASDSGGDSSGSDSDD